MLLEFRPAEIKIDNPIVLSNTIKILVVKNNDMIEVLTLFVSITTITTKKEASIIIKVINLFLKFFKIFKVISIKTRCIIIFFLI